MELVEIVEIEFPSVSDGEKFLSLDLKRVVQTRTYKKAFLINKLAEHLYYHTVDPDLCWPELWIIKNNPKYNYLWKKEEGVTLE